MSFWGGLFMVEKVDELSFCLLDWWGLREMSFVSKNMEFMGICFMAKMFCIFNI